MSGMQHSRAGDQARRDTVAGHGGAGLLCQYSAHDHHAYPPMHCHVPSVDDVTRMPTAFCTSPQSASLGTHAPVSQARSGRTVDGWPVVCLHLNCTVLYLAPRWVLSTKVTQAKEGTSHNCRRKRKWPGSWFV